MTNGEEKSSGKGEEMTRNGEGRRKKQWKGDEMIRNGEKTLWQGKKESGKEKTR